LCVAIGVCCDAYAPGGLMTNYSGDPGRLGPMPNYPMPSAELPGAMESPTPAPSAVQTAFRLGIASVVVGMVDLLLRNTIADPYAVMQRAMQRGARAGSTVHTSHAYLTALLIMGAVFAIVGLALRVFLLLKMRAGRNWARIVLTVLIGMGLLGTLFSLAFVRFVFEGLGWLLAGSALALLFDAAVVVFMYRPAANRYFSPPQPFAAYPPPMPGYYRAQPMPLPRERYSPWHVRALSGLIDHGLPTVLFFLFYIPFANGRMGYVTAPSVPVMLTVIAACIAFQGYNSVFRQGRTGQSLGKTVAKTNLIDERTAQVLGVGRAFGRLCAHFLDSAICYVGWLFPVWDGKRQTLADKIVGSVVMPIDDLPD